MTKRFYFSNGIISLLFGHPYLEELKKEKLKYRHTDKVIHKKRRFFKRGEQGSRKDSKIKYS